MTCITSRAGRRLLLALSLTLGLLAAAPLTSPAQAMQLTPVQKQEMKLHYDKATRAYDVGKYNEAVEEYQKAYEIGGDPAMLYNIGQAYRLGDQPGEAVRFYRRYLQRSPQARNRDDVERRIADLEKLAEARRQAGPVTPVPPVATTPATPAPAPTPSQPPVIVPPPMPAPSVIPPPTGSVVEEEGSGQGRRIAAYTLLGVGVVGLAVSGYFLKVAGEKSDKIAAMAAKGNEEFDPAVERNGQRADTVAIISGIVGAAALVGSGILFLTGGGPSAAEETAPRPAGATVVPVMGVGHLGVSAAWSF